LEHNLRTNPGGLSMSESYDILIQNATIVDGSGQPAYRGNVGIRGERIVAVGETGDQAADRVIDGRGLIACPGFIDPHSHANRGVVDTPTADNLVMQGITTFLGDNCGMSSAPTPDLGFAEWLAEADSARPSVNYATLVGHNTLRRTVMGDDWHRAATAKEVAAMEALVEEAMQAGAYGLSDGLDAAWPGHFAAVSEIVTLARMAQRYGGFYTPHTRHHQNQWPADRPDEYGYGLFHAPKGETIVGRYHGLLEAVEISRQANRIPLLIVHLTPAYLVPQPHPAYLDDCLAQATLEDIIDKPRNEGLDVTFNAIAWGQSIASEAPLMASFFDASQLRPDWLVAMDVDSFTENLKTRAFRAKVRGFIESGKFKIRMMHPLSDPYWMDCIQIVRSAVEPAVGRTIGEMARERSPHSILEAVYESSWEVVFDLLVEDPDTTCADFVDKREYGALKTFLAHPAGMPCTDVGILPAKPQLPPSEGLYTRGVSPTAYGLFPHYLRMMVREWGALSLEEAIRKATSLPAGVIGLPDRGRLAEGACADVVLFDLETLQENADFRNPAQAPKGIRYVLVNGQIVCEDGAHTGARPGKVLRHG
jgi:N-acyl-D-amino-acid deacylase